MFFFFPPAQSSDRKCLCFEALTGSQVMLKNIIYIICKILMNWKLEQEVFKGYKPPVLIPSRLIKETQLLGKITSGLISVICSHLPKRGAVVWLLCQVIMWVREQDLDLTEFCWYWDLHWHTRPDFLSGDPELSVLVGVLCWNASVAFQHKAWMDGYYYTANPYCWPI